jgi:putative cardiolipin synthase
VGALIQEGLKVFIYKGDSLTGQDFLSPEIKSARWGIHAKSAVLDEKTIMVGTFNADPRSRNINAEMAIICRDNQELAAEVLNNMKEHEAQSVQLNGEGKPFDGSSAFANVSVPKRIMYYLSAPLSNVFDFLL